MKNVGIVVRNNVTATFDLGLNAVLETLFLGGYTFEELRFLNYANEKGWISAIRALQADCDNLFLIAEKRCLTRIKQALLGAFPNGQACSDFGGALIYVINTLSVYLLSSDETETGVGYIQNACIPFMQKKFNLRFDKLILRAVGANIALTEKMLAEARRLGGDKIVCNHIRKYDEDVIEILYDSNTPKMLADDILRMFAEGFGDTMYALNDTKLENQLVSLLRVRGKKLSVAESFTGGGIARRIVSVSGASEVYFEGLNTYNEASKVKRLGVSPYTLKTLGAVSERTAYEMALGLLSTGDCDIAVATTGLAGPKSDKSELPVGLCCIAVGTKEKICVYQYKFDGTRQDITEKAINYALFLTYKRLKDI